MDQQLTKKYRRQRNIFITLTSVLILMNALCIWQLLSFSNKIDTIIVEKKVVSNEKEQMLSKLEKLNLEYSALQDKYQGLDSLFSVEKERIVNLIGEIKAQRGNTLKYKDQVAQLEVRLNEYLAQIQELKNKNEKLIAENVDVKTSLKTVVQEKDQLTKDKDELVYKIEKGSSLKAYDINMTSFKLKKDGQEIITTKAKRVDGLKVCFVLGENTVAPSGYKTIYLRIAAPDGSVIYDGSVENNSFEYNGKKIVYTSKEQIIYANKAMELCLKFDKKREYKPGVYSVDLFVDGISVGTTSLKLN